MHNTILIMRVFRLLLVIAVMMVSCSWQRPFNRQLWDEVGDLESSPFRKEMVKDVLDNHLKPGMHYQDVKKLLGDIHSDVTSDSIGHIVLVYGFYDEYSGIDYEHSNGLEITFSTDSLLTDAAYKDFISSERIYQLED